MENKSDLTALLQQGFRFAYALTHHHAKAEDLLQSAWLAILKADGPHNKAYLFRAIRNHFYNAYRREKSVPMIPLDSAMNSEDDLLDSSDWQDPLRAFDFEQIELMLSSLRPIEREVIFLSAVEGYTAQEIASSTEFARGTVLSLLHRAKKKLRVELAELAENE